MARGQYQTKVQRPSQDAVEAATGLPAGLACRTCPFWTALGAGKGVCHGSSGPLTLHGGNGLFAITQEYDWCRLHPQAPK